MAYNDVLCESSDSGLVVGYAGVLDKDMRVFSKQHKFRAQQYTILVVAQVGCSLYCVLDRSPYVKPPQFNEMPDLTKAMFKSLSSVAAFYYLQHEMNKKLLVSLFRVSVVCRCWPSLGEPRT